MTTAQALGRSLAYCAHPAVAWRRLSAPRRVLLLGAYFAGAYVLTLAALFVV